MGMTKVCPGCGTHVPGAIASCASCGHTFGATIIRPNRGWSGRARMLAVVAGLLFVAGVLAALFLPGFLRARRLEGQATCAKNLVTLHKMMAEYAHQFGKPLSMLSNRTGGDFWIHLSQTAPPLVTDLGLFACPIEGGSNAAGTTDYRGPSRNGNVAGLGPTDPMGADKVGNHGFHGGGNVLRKNGELVESGEYDPLWVEAGVKTSP